MLINKILNSIVLAVLMAIGVMLPATTYAQSDGFFCGSNDEYTNRAAEGLSNETFGSVDSGTPVQTIINAPLGSGLWIMLAAGAGYAISRRKRARKGMTLLLAAAMLLGTSQCKKKVDTISSVDAGNVFVTLNLVNNSKYDVNTATGGVEYKTGDKIHVGCDGKYVGTLTHDGTHFRGNIANPEVGKDLWFYFVSGLLDETKMSSSTTTYNVSISDQSTQLLVLSCGMSTEPYAEGKTSYTSILHNQCALAKFTLDSQYESSEITLCNTLSEATIDFANQTITPTGKKDCIKINNPTGGTSKERWCVFLPQSYANGTKRSAKADDAYCTYYFYGIFQGIQANGYYSGNVSAAYNTHGFTVSKDGNAVIFSPGNLQYNLSNGSWRFAEHPWDCIGQDNSKINNPSYTGYIDLFGWGTWGVGGNPAKSSTISDDYGWSADFNGTVTNDAATDWCTLTIDQWNYLLNDRSVEMRFIKTVYHDTMGILIFPDDFYVDQHYPSQALLNVPEGVYNNMKSIHVYTSTAMETDDIVAVFLSKGAVFLPAAGSRTGTSVQYTNVVSQMAGYYWSSTPNGTNNSGNMWFGYGDGNMGDAPNCKGYSVRLVR